MDRFRKILIMAVSSSLALAFALADPAPASSAPTVNGLFYGDGDNLRYPSQPYAYSIGRSRLYVTVVNQTLYAVLVLNRYINDNVFSPNRDYTNSAGWSSPRPGNRLIDSEFAEFSLTIGTGADAQTWTWQQGYAGVASGATSNTNETWISGTTVSGGGSTPPPGLVSASSMAWNMNNYAYRVNNGIDPGWNMGPATGPNQWTSPITNPSNPASVINAAEGHPGPSGNPPIDAAPITYSPTYQWEWSMVYEWSVDLSQFEEVPLFVLTGDSHHSPIKNEVYPPDRENDPFLELNQGDPEPLFDYGDLPGPYPTWREDTGARHVIDPTGAYLGAQVDSEPDGQPHFQARGDDLGTVDDEDGVVLLTPLVAGSEAIFEITVGSPGYLSAFIDWFATGSLNDAAVTVVSPSGPAAVAPGSLLDTRFSAAGIYQVTVAVPGNAIGMMASRFRITTAAGEGGASPTGRAESGEVEDYIWLASVGDRVWSDHNRNGLQDEGEPGVSGATVRLLDAQGQPVLDGEGNPITAVTDAEGNYLFSDLIPGQYQIEFELPENFHGFTEQDADAEGIAGVRNSDADPSTDRTAPFTLWPGDTELKVDAGLLQFGPTSVRLEEFSAAGYAGAVAVEWRTGAETDNLGFLVYRSGSRGGPFQPVSEFIPTLDSNPGGARYLFIDRAVADGVTYYYRLKAVSTGGKNAFHGPVEARAGQNGQEFAYDPADYAAVVENVSPPAPAATPTPAARWTTPAQAATPPAAEAPTATPLPAPAPSPACLCPLGVITNYLDYDGDGLSDIAVFRCRCDSGLWSVRGVTRVYFGRQGDIPVPGDYDGDGIANIAVFRPGTGLWETRDGSRRYFGRKGDIPVPADYAGDGRDVPSIFRPDRGIWAILGLTRAYFGGPEDRPVPGDYDGDGRTDIAVFRPATGLWSVRAITRLYFGNPADVPVPGDYQGDGTDLAAIYRPAAGIWAVRGWSRFHFGRPGDIPVPMDPTGDAALEPAIFRPDSGLWAIKGVTRVYFGSGSEVPVTR